MSVLDDIRSNAEAAHGSFDEAKTLVKQASDEASELEQSAADHGWAGLAQAMTSAQETLEEAARVIEGAMTATSEGMSRLSEITEEMSSDEVASRLAAIGQRFETARSAASQAVESLEEARTSAEQADAETLAQLVDSAEESLTTGRETLASAVSDTESEQSEATNWGNWQGAAAHARSRRPGTEKWQRRQQWAVPAAGQQTHAAPLRGCLKGSRPSSSRGPWLPLAKVPATSAGTWSFTEAAPPVQRDRTRTSTSRSGWTDPGSTS